MRLHDNGGVVLCGRGKCCPVMVKVSEDTYQITDDDGKTITIKKDQLDEIQGALTVLEKRQLITEVGGLE